MKFWTIPLLIILFCGCKYEKEQNAGKTVFRYNEAFGISSLDPAFANNQSNIWACNHLYNGLTELDSNLIPIPSLARSWEISDDGRTYTFHLKTDVFFHPHPLFNKPRKLIAADVVFSFNRIADEKTASPGAWIFNYARKDVHGNLNAFHAPDDSTVVIHLSDPFPPFTGLLASGYGGIVPHEIVNHYGRDFRTHPVGTGPFKFHEWIERTALILHRNDNYFETDEAGTKLPYLDAVMISFISDRQSAFLEFLKGRLDLINGLDAGFKDDLLTPSGKMREKYKGKFRMETAPYLNTEYLGILADTSLPAMKNNPLNDIRVRKAISLGFDRNKMIRYLRNSMVTPGTAGIVPLGVPGFDSMQTQGYDYNPQLAAQLLKEAGFPDGKGLPQIVLSTTGSYQDLTEYVQGQLAGLGIKIKLEVNQSAQHRLMVSKQQLTFFRASWIADYADAENYLSLFLSKNKAPAGPNYTHFSNKKYDELYAKAMNETNDSLRWKLYREMDQLVMDNVPVIVLYYDRVLRLTSNNVHGLPKNPMNLLTLKNVKLN